MKFQNTLLTLSLIGCVILAGCQEQQAEPTVDTSQVNRKIVDTYSDLAIQNAIISQHTLYAYHFVNNSAQLNQLGQRDLSVLIQHFKDNPGQINLQPGGADSQLQQARSQIVYEKLLAGGIPDNKIRIAAGMPGGDGMPSTWVIEFFEKVRTDGLFQTSDMETEF